MHQSLLSKSYTYVDDTDFHAFSKAIPHLRLLLKFSRLILFVLGNVKCLLHSYFSVLMDMCFDLSTIATIEYQAHRFVEVDVPFEGQNELPPWAFFD